jgi:hypothetical protein
MGSSSTTNIVTGVLVDGVPFMPAITMNKEHLRTLAGKRVSKKLSTSRRKIHIAPGKFPP